MKAVGRKGLFLALAAAFFSRAAFSQGIVRSMRLYREQNYEEARHAARSEVEMDDASIESYVVLAWSLLKQNRVVEAQYWANEAQKKDVYDLKLVEVLGEINFFMGNNADALNYLQIYVARAGSAEIEPVAYYYIGEIFIRQKQFNHADIAFSRAVMLNGLHSQWWAKLGYAREMCRRYDKAFEAYETALKIDAASDGAAEGKSRVAKRLRGR